MSYIEIVSLPNGTPVVSNYFFKDGTPGKRHIDPGETAYVPDDELAIHLETQAVREVKADDARQRVVNPEDAPRPGRKPTQTTGEGSGEGGN